MFVLMWETHMESKLAREVVHATGVHKTESVSHSLCTQHVLACDWTDSSVSQSGRYDTA